MQAPLSSEHATCVYFFVLKAFHAPEDALGYRNKPKCLEEIALITKMLVNF